MKLKKSVLEARFNTWWYKLYESIKKFVKPPYTWDQLLNKMEKENDKRNKESIQ